MPNIIKPKRKYTTGAPIASQLAQGELAINLFDKKIYSKDLLNNIVLLSSLNGSSTEKYKVANAVATDEAVNKGQLDDALANLGNLSIFLNSKNPNGYQKLPSGLIIQWGTNGSNVSSGVGIVKTFPVTFPNAVFSCVLQYADAVTPSTKALINIYSLTTSAVLYNLSESGSRGIYFIAIGY